MNEQFFIDVALAIIALVTSGRIIYLILNHDAYFRKHKAGTIEHIRAKQLVSVKARIIAATVTLLLFLKTVLDGRSMVHAEGRTGIVDIGLIVGFLSLGTIVIILIGFSISKEFQKKGGN